MSLPTEAPLTSRPRWVPRRRSNPFRMMRLNTVGWSALVGSGLVLAVPGLVLGRNPGLAVASGVGAAFTVVWSNDYRNWRRSWTGIGYPMPDEEADVLAAEMRSDGLDVIYEPAVLDEGTGEMRVSARFRCRAPHARKVRERLGLPDFPRGRRQGFL